MNSSDAIQYAISLLLQGKLIGIPTETVYGLAADAKNESAVLKIFQAKGRPKTNPLIIHLSDPSAMEVWASSIPKEAYQLSEQFWPGPLTLILPKHQSVPHITTGGQETVGIRVPNHPVALQLLREFQKQGSGGLAAPSANRYQRLSPTTSEHVKEELKDAVDYVLEGGPCQHGIESTIVSLMNDKIEILRLGAIAKEELENSLKRKIAVPTLSSIFVPGMDNYHYAPNKTLYLLSLEALTEKADYFVRQGKRVSILSFAEPPASMLNEGVHWMTVLEDARDYARHLYARLRFLDKQDGEAILVEMPKEEEAWLAILDRLTRAGINN